MKKIIILLMPFLALCMPLSAFGKDGFRNIQQNTGIIIKEANTGKIIRALNSDRLFAPASVSKIITTATALNVFGADYRFETDLCYAGKIINGVLYGNIVISGGGDPTLGSDRFPEKKDFLPSWLNAIRNAGITKISGDIIVDASLFDKEPVSPFWIREDAGNYFAAGAYPLAVYDNMFEVGFKSGEVGSKPVVVSVSPATNLLDIDNNLISANNNKDSAYFYGEPYLWKRPVFGTIPANRSLFKVKCDNPDPQYFFSVIFKEYLNSNGIAVSGESKVSYSKIPEVEVIYRQYSPELIDVINITNKYSDNLYAEYLLRRLSLEYKKEKATEKNGIAFIKSYWKACGLDVAGYNLFDGCGLSPLDRITPEFLSGVLSVMSGNIKFINSLPMAGKEGTVSGCWLNPELKGVFNVKSGTLSFVCAYAGYYRIGNEKYVVVYIVNDIDISHEEVRKDIRKYLEKL